MPQEVGVQRRDKVLPGVRVVDQLRYGVTAIPSGAATVRIKVQTTVNRLRYSIRGCDCQNKGTDYSKPAEIFHQGLRLSE